MHRWTDWQMNRQGNTNTHPPTPTPPPPPPPPPTPPHPYQLHCAQSIIMTLTVYMANVINKSSLSLWYICRHGFIWQKLLLVRWRENGTWNKVKTDNFKKSPAKKPFSSYAPWKHIDKHMTCSFLYLTIWITLRIENNKYIHTGQLFICK